MLYDIFKDSIGGEAVFVFSLSHNICSFFDDLDTAYSLIRLPLCADCSEYIWQTGRYLYAGNDTLHRITFSCILVEATAYFKGPFKFP